MNKIERARPLAGYDQDFARWSAEQAALLRQGRLEFLDIENVAEEIESLGRSDKREIASQVGVILLHLLKWEFQPEKRKPGWFLTLQEQRGQIGTLISESPSLKATLPKALVEEFALARLKAANETELPIRTFPVQCPYSVEDVTSRSFLPGEPWAEAAEYLE